MEPIFRRARSEDAAALAELIWIAGESPSGSSYDVFFGGGRNSQRDRLLRLIRAETRTHFSYCNFFVTEVDGEVAAGACGFDPRSSGKQNLLRALREVGWSATEIADAMERMSPVLTCAAEEPPDAWVLDHVATLPRFRGCGLARGAVFRVIEEGFAAGFDRVQLSVLVGNEIARRLYVNLGFRREGRPRTDPRFEAVMGSPGTETLVLRRRDWTSVPGEHVGSSSRTTESSRRLLPDPTVPLAEPEVGLAAGAFLSWAAGAPGAAAVVGSGGVLTYADLEAHSRSIAELLIDRGMTRGEVVAVTGARSAGLVAAMLGVLRSGGVLLTLDPALPAQRRKVMVAESGARRVLIAGETADESVRGLEAIQIRQDGALAGSPPERVDLPTPSPDDPAYIFFTSGTSGVPKGVLGSHKGLSHFLKWQRETFTIGPGDRCAHLTGLSFDVVLRDVFLPLTSGASLCLPDLDEETAVSKTLLWLEREAITVLHAVPAIVQSWLAAVPQGVSLHRLRWAFFAGEPLTDSLVRRWVAAFPQAGRIVNLYGPTETTLAKCFFVVPQDPPPGIQPIGRPLPDAQALVMAEGRLCEIGEIGEIVLRTPFRTLGYVNAPDEQRSRFVPNPFRNDPRDLLYRTGDRGRYLPDGSLAIFGRVDDQVKIRGVRVEPQEVAAVLSCHPAVANCAVVSRKQDLEEIDLVAYVVSRRDPPPTVEELQRDLARRLSPVMIPSAFVFLRELPLTPNGKLDRAALPPPEVAPRKRDETAPSPRTPIENVVASIWASVLGVEDVGVDDDFFELGGHSLKAAQVVSRVGRSFGLDLPLRALFEAPALASFASRVEESLLAEVENEIPADASGNDDDGSVLLDRKAVLD